MVTVRSGASKEISTDLLCPFDKRLRKSRKRLRQRTRSIWLVSLTGARITSTQTDWKVGLAALSIPTKKVVV